ncbi:hypothetical protein ACOMHN_048631 [Nucella lapillus]
MQPSDCYPTLPLGSKMMCINISWNLASCTTARLPPSAAAVRGDCTDCGMVCPPLHGPALDHSITVCLHATSTRLWSRLSSSHIQTCSRQWATPPSHPSILPNFLPLTVCCPLSHRWAVNPVTPLHSRLHHRCSRVVNPATPLLSRLHHHCRRAVNPLHWHSRLHHHRRRVVNLAMPLDSRPHHQHCCCVLVTLL